MYRSVRPVDMTHAVLNYGSTRPYGQVRMYGAGACEAADERLLEEVKARRLASDQVKARRQVAAARITTTEVNEGIIKQLAEVQARRQFLEQELKKIKAMEAILIRKAERASEERRRAHEKKKAKEDRECKRKVALDGKKKAMGVKPKGITKAVAAKQTSPKAARSFREFTRL